jgi:hypothetical protein
MLDIEFENSLDHVQTEDDFTNIGKSINFVYIIIDLSIIKDEWYEIAQVYRCNAHR